MQQYEMISKLGLQDFGAAMDRKMAEGWRAYGNPTTHCVPTDSQGTRSMIYSQAVVKEPANEQDS